jgi:hypothetical protein
MANDLDTQPVTIQQRLTCALRNARCNNLNNTGNKVLVRVNW